MPELHLSSQAERVYRRLDATTRRRLDHLFERLEVRGVGDPAVRPLQGALHGRFRARLGQWRVVFVRHPGDDVLVVEAITTRGGAYR